MDTDVLDFVAINPHYNPLKYQPDGLCTTWKERDKKAAEASNDDQDYGMDWISAPLPPSMATDTSSPATRQPPLSSASGMIMPPEPTLPTIVTRPLAEDLARLDSAIPSAIPSPISALRPPPPPLLTPLPCPRIYIPQQDQDPIRGVPSPPTTKGELQNSLKWQNCPNEWMQGPGIGPTTSNPKWSVASSTLGKQLSMHNLEQPKAHAVLPRNGGVRANTLHMTWSLRLKSLLQFCTLS